jgi:hypothetical protein
MHAAGDRMEEGAVRALGVYQKIRDVGGTPQIQHSQHHGWVVTDLNRDHIFDAGATRGT